VRNFILGILFAIVVLLAGGYFCLAKGYVNFAADQRPSLMEAKLAMAAVDAWTDRRAPEGKNPIQPTEENIAAGAKIYLDHCAGCHGVPSNPDSQFARSFNPPAPGFFKDAPDMPESQNFYIIQHGVRWTGMPAWSKTLNETQTWQIVTFLSNLEKLPPGAQKVFGPSAAAPTPTPMPMPMPMAR
jgi:thiosulfate dehydrogenase